MLKKKVSIINAFFNILMIYLTLFRMGLFAAGHRRGAGGERGEGGETAIPKISATHILHRWNLAQFYLT